MSEVGTTSAQNGWRSCLALVAILLIVTPALLLGVDVRLSTHTMENLAIVTSQEAFLRHAEDPSTSFLVSTNDHQPRLEKPPMVVWLNLLAWTGLDASSASPQELIGRARCVSAAMGLMLLAAIFLIAHTLGDMRLAVLATLSIASTFFFQRQARTASYDIHYVAWTTLAIGLGLWAMNPLGPPPAGIRRVAGWGGCALALTAAVMSKNPLPYLLGLPPLIAAIVLLSPRRRADALGLTLAALVSAAPVAAWYWHVFATFPRLAQRALGREVSQPRSEYQPLWYYLGLLGLVVPWTLWLVGAIIEPFRIERDGRAGRRRIALFALLWFALIFVAMSIPAAKQQRYILGILPSVGMLLAIFIRQHDDRAGRGVEDRVFRVLSAATWCALALASVGAAWFMTSQQQYVSLSGRWLERPRPVLLPITWPMGLALLAALLTVCIVGWRAHARGPWRSSVALAIWMIVVMTVFWSREAAIPDPRVQAFVDEAARIRGIVGDAPLRSLRITREDSHWFFNEEFRIYYNRLIRRIGPDEVSSWISDLQGDAFVVARPSIRATTLLSRLGFEHVDQVQIDRNELHDLWRVRVAPR